MKESNEVVNASKTVYKFKPASQSANPVGAVFHWNYITKEQYDVLCRFYSDSMIKMEEEY